MVALATSHNSKHYLLSSNIAERMSELISDHGEQAPGSFSKYWSFVIAAATCGGDVGLGVISVA
jgi:hypothetical protein